MFCIGLILLQGLLLGGFSLYRHWTFNSGAFDLGIFTQVVWSSAQGRLFENTLSESANFLGQHLSPILLVFVPLFWPGGGAESLIVVQALLIALGALPVAWYARKILTDWAATVPVIAYLFHPSLAAAATFDFHEIAAAVPLLSLALAGLLARRPRTFYPAALVLLLVKEDLGIVVAGLAVFAFIRNGWKRAGLALAIGGIAWTAIAVLVVIPAAHGGGDYYYLTRYGELGSSPGAILTSLVTRPGEAISVLLAPRKLLFLGQLVLTTGGLALFAPLTLLLALPNAGYLILGQYRPLTELLAHYAATIVPVLAFAAADGLAARRRRFPAPFPYMPVLLACLGLLLVFDLFQLAALLPRRVDNGLANDSAHIAAINAMLARIPADAAVSAQTGLAAHLATRRKIYLFPELGDADWIAADTRAQRFSATKTTYEEGLEELLCDRTFGPIVAEDGLLLFRRGASADPYPAAMQAPTVQTDARFSNGMRLRGFKIDRPVVRRLEVVHVLLYWETAVRQPRDWTVFVHLQDMAGNVRAQSDNPPLCGDAPTSSWTPSRLLQDDIWLIPQRPIAAGEYNVVLGVFDPGSGDRVTVNGPADSVELGAVSVRD